MKKNKNTSVLFVVACLFFLVGSFLLSGCESSRVGPDLPTPNPPAPPAQPLVLKGSVVDSKTGGAVSGATVQMLKQDGTTVTTIATDATGNFSYDITTLNLAVLKITATATGFGFSFVYATVDLVNKAVQTVAIPLDKIQTTAVNLTPAGGTVTIPTNNESVSGQGVTIVVPANAVTQNVTVAASQVSVNNVPPPLNSAASTQVGVTNLTPAGIIFAQPVRLSIPLPYEMNTGDLLPIQELVNNNWVSSSLSATVDNTFTTANVNVTKTAQYALTDNTVISGTVSGSIISNDDGSKTFSLSKVLETKEYGFSSGTLNITDLTGSRVWTVTKTKKGIRNLPADPWWINQLRQRYGASLFVGFTGLSSTTTFPVPFYVPWPGIPPKAATPDGAGNIDYPGVTGSWSVRVTVTSTSASLFNPPAKIENAFWLIQVTSVTNSWVISKKEWVWTGHNQGAVSYPF